MFREARASYRKLPQHTHTHTYVSVLQSTIVGRYLEAGEASSSAHLIRFMLVMWFYWLVRYL